jgi:hypothetical protein
MSKERKKRNPPTQTTLSLYTVHPPPMNHSSRSNIPSEFHSMIWYSTGTIHYHSNHTILSDITAPQPTSLLYYIILQLPRRFLRIFQRLSLSIAQFLSPHHRISRLPLYSLNQWHVDWAPSRQQKPPGCQGIGARTANWPRSKSLQAHPTYDSCR